MGAKTTIVTVNVTNVVATIVAAVGVAGITVVVRTGVVALERVSTASHWT
jgi:hypothetical protein